MIVADIDGTITAWNSDAEKLLGYPAVETIGQRVDLIIPPEHRDAHWTGFQRAMTAPQLKDLAADLPVKCADHEIRYLAGRLVVLQDALGQAAGAAAIFTDAASTGNRPSG